MLALKGLVQLELGATNDNLVAVRDVMLEHFLERHHLRHQLPRVRIRNERQHDDAERRLHRGMLVELVQHDARNRVSLQLEHDAHAILVRLVAQIGDAFELLVAYELGDVLNELRLVDLIRKLVDHDLRLVRALLLLDHRAGAHHDLAAATLLVILDAGAAVDVAPGREIGSLDQLSDFARCHLWIVDQRDDGGDDFAEIVGRDIGRHSDRDTRRAVDDEVRNRRGKNLGLLQSIVEVRRETDGVLVDVGEHLHRDAGESRLGIAIGRSRIAIDRAEISLAIDQRIAQREILHHAHERVVHRRITVGVILAEHVAYDSR